MTVRRDFSRDGVELVLWLAACCALVLTGCSEPINSQTRDEVPAPVVVRLDTWEPPRLTEAAVLADRILRREHGNLLLDGADRRELASEVVSVLSRLRDAYPKMADVTAQEPYVFGVLFLNMEPWLFGAVASLFENQPGPVELRTGHAEFDALNARLGLSVVVDIFTSFGAVLFYFNEYLNVPAAAAAYTAVEGIEFAEPSGYLGDGSDLDMVHSQGHWYVVVRRAWGDCPSGCINEELHFFIVNDTELEQIEHTRAMEIGEFRKLVMNRGW